MIVIQQKSKYIGAAIAFKDMAHHLFYKECLQKADREGDVYHEALFYLLGLTDATRQNIQQLYDFEEQHIKLAALNKDWQTGTSILICRLAFNLYSGYMGDKTRKFAKDYTPYSLFCCECGNYMLEAIKLRYPEYCLHTNGKKKG